MSSASYIRKIFLMLFIFVSLSSFASAALLDPLVDIFASLGIENTLQNYPIVWDTILVTTLLVMVFGRVLKDKLGYGTGAVLGIIVSAAFVFFEVRTGFSLVQNLGPYAFLIVVILLLFSLYRIMSNFLGNIALAATWVFGYPLIMGIIPTYLTSVRQFSFFAFIEVIMVILWFISIWIFIRGIVGFVRGTGSGFGGGMGGGGFGDIEKKEKNIENQNKNQEKKEKEDWEELKSYIQNKMLKVLKKYLENAESERQAMNNGENRDVEFSRNLEGFVEAFSQEVRVIMRNNHKIQNKEEFQEIIENLEVLLKDFYIIADSAVKNGEYPYYNRPNINVEDINKNYQREIQLIVNAISGLLHICEAVEVEKEYLIKLEQLIQAMIHLGQAERAEERMHRQS